jgi:hypothetical protein
MTKSLFFKTKNLVSTQKTHTSVRIGDYTFHVNGGRITVGIHTGRKPGPHYGGAWQLNK